MDEFIPYEDLSEEEKQSYRDMFFDTAATDLFSGLTPEQAASTDVFEDLVAQFYEEAAIPLGAEEKMLSAAQEEANILGEQVATQRRLGDETLLSARRKAGQELARALGQGTYGSGATIGALTSGASATEQALGGARQEIESALTEAQRAFTQASGQAAAQEAESVARRKEIAGKAGEEIMSQAQEQMSSVGVGDVQGAFQDFSNKAAKGGTGYKTGASRDLMKTALNALQQGNISFFDDAVERIFNTLKKRSGLSEYSDGYLIDYTKSASSSAAGVPFEIPSHFTTDEGLDDFFLQVFGLPRDQVVSAVLGE